MTKEERELAAKARRSELSARKERLPESYLDSGYNEFPHLVLQAGSTWLAVVTRDKQTGDKSEHMISLNDASMLSEFIYALSCRLRELTSEINASTEAATTVLREAKVREEQPKS